MCLCPAKMAEWIKVLFGVETPGGIYYPLCCEGGGGGNSMQLVGVSTGTID